MNEFKLMDWMIYKFSILEVRCGDVNICVMGEDSSTSGVKFIK